MSAVRFRFAARRGGAMLTGGVLPLAGRVKSESKLRTRVYGPGELKPPSEFRLSAKPSCRISR